MGPCNRVPRPGATARSSTAGGSLTPHPCVETSDTSRAVGAPEPLCSSFLVSRLAGTGSFVWFLLAPVESEGTSEPRAPGLPHSPSLHRTRPAGCHPRISGSRARVQAWGCLPPHSPQKGSRETAIFCRPRVVGAGRACSSVASHGSHSALSSCL